MNLITTVIITVLLSQRLIQCDECDVKLLKTAFPDPDYLIYGLREDRSILLLPSDIVNNDSVSEKLPSLLDDGLSKGPDINHYDVS
uniref:Bm1601 n=1 Tax=Brugia malayi TaxID=6279 RepID=A0A1I9G761_BRUMA|nr:Bm1601 [Brugia malayi]